MIADTKLSLFVDRLKSMIGKLLKRARKRWRNRAAPKRRKTRRKSAASKAGSALARRRWQALKRDNVIPFKRKRAGS